MDDYNITYLPNASMLKFLPQEEFAPLEDILVLGNPTTELAPLPGAEQSAQTIADLFNTTPFIMDKATEAAVRKEIVNADILHLGAHADYNSVAPLESTIHLSAGDKSNDFNNDGKLLAREVYGLPMENTNLVVLSACQTSIGNLDRDSIDGISNISPGDEIVSLNRAFLFHSPTVISTLWTVDDKPTSLLMEQFYTNLKSGMSKADSLLQAQLYVRDYGDGEYANPYNWAGFILSGDAGQVEFSVEATSTPIVPIETEVSVTEMETAVPEAKELPNSGGNMGCPGAALPLALAALVQLGVNTCADK